MHFYNQHRDELLLSAVKIDITVIIQVSTPYRRDNELYILLKRMWLGIRAGCYLFTFLQQLHHRSNGLDTQFFTEVIYSARKPLSTEQREQRDNVGLQRA